MTIFYYCSLIVINNITTNKGGGSTTRDVIIEYFKFRPISQHLPKNFGRNARDNVIFK